MNLKTPLFAASAGFLLSSCSVVSKPVKNRDTEHFTNEEKAVQQTKASWIAIKSECQGHRFYTPSRDFAIDKYAYPDHHGFTRLGFTSDGQVYLQYNNTTNQSLDIIPQRTVYLGPIEKQDSMIQKTFKAAKIAMGEAKAKEQHRYFTKETAENKNEVTISTALGSGFSDKKVFDLKNKKMSHNGGEFSAQEFLENKADAELATKIAQNEKNNRFLKRLKKEYN